MIRVALPAIGGRDWPAGRIYLWNLLFAITSLPNREIQPVLLDESDLGREFDAVSAERCLVPPILSGDRVRLMGRASKYLLGRDLVLEAMLRRAGADLFSHGPPLGRRSRVRQLPWIPDLQHRHLPQLFSPLERVGRDRAFREAVRDAKRVIVSSEAARSDLIALTGRAGERKARVLHFVSQPRLTTDSIASRVTLADKYRLPGRYFHLPNQFWRHKNHGLVVDALTQAVSAEPELTVVCTGAAEDYRDRDYYPQLMARVKTSRLTDRFRHLGVVPFADLIALMKHAVAVINPSRFEGWSTTVEEAKSLGKIVLASNIPVHREQDAPRARYFDVDDANELAALLVDTWRSVDEAADARAAADAALQLRARTLEFGAAYERIVVEAMDE